MDLATALRSRPLAIVAGSRFSGSRSGQQVVSDLLEATQPDGTTTLRSWLQGSRLRRHLGPELETSLAQALLEEPLGERIALATLPVDLVLTTSVGDDWERAFAQVDKVVHSVCPGQSPDYDFDAVIYHLFGSAKEPGSMSLCEADLDRHIDETDLLSLVHGWSSSRVFVFVGFSMEDDETRLVFERLLPRDSKREHFAFLSDATDAEQGELKEHFGIRLIGDDSEALVSLSSILSKGPASLTREISDLDAIMARAAIDAGDPAVESGLELLEYRLRQDGAYERLVDLYVARLSLAEEPTDRQRILLETANLLEDEMQDVARAFHATLSAYREKADASLWPTLERRAQGPQLRRIFIEALLESSGAFDKGLREELLLLAAEGLRGLGLVSEAVDVIDDSKLNPHAHERLGPLYVQLLEESERWYELARALLRAGDRADLLDDREALLEKRADLLEHRLSEPWGALDCYQQILADNPQNERALAAVERLFVELHQVPALLDFFVDYGAHYSEAELNTKLWRLGERCKKTNDATGALLCFERLREKEPHNEKLLAILSELYADLGETSRLVDILKAKVGGASPGPERAALCKQLAEAQEEMNHVDEAAECWEWVWHDDPGSEEAVEALERLYRQSGRWQSLLAVYGRERNAAADSDKARWLLAMAEVYASELGDLGPAIELLQEARESGQLDPELNRRLMNMLEESGRPADAARLAYQVGEATESEERAQWYRRAGELWHQNGQLAQAARGVEAAIEAAPKDAALHALLGKIRHEEGEFQLAAEAFDQASMCSTGAESTGYALQAASCFENVNAADRGIEVLEQRWQSGTGERAVAQELRRLYEAKGRHADLIALLEKQNARVRREEQIEQLLAMADAHAALRNWKQELECLERALAAAPERYDIARQLAEAALRHGRHELTASVCETLISEQAAVEDQVAGYCLLAQQAIARDKRDEAMEHLGQARERMPFDRKVLALLVELASDKPDAQIGYLRALLLDAPRSERAEILVRIGDLCSSELDEKEEARDAYQGALQLRPDDHLLLHRCLAIAVENKEWDESLEYLDRLINSEADPAVRARYRSTTAHLYEEELGNLDKSIELLWLAVEEAPSDQNILGRLAQILRAKEDWQGLLECTSRLLAALRDDPSVTKEAHARAWHELAKLCTSELEDRETAMCALEVAVNLHPKNVDYRLDLAQCYQDDGRSDAAIAQNQAILDLEPTLLTSYNALAKLYEKSGHGEAAQACRLGAQALLGKELGEESVQRVPKEALDKERMRALRHEDDNVVLGRLFALMTPALAMLMPKRRRRKSTIAGRRPLDAKHPANEAVTALAERLGVYSPIVYVDRHQDKAVDTGVERRDEMLVPVVIFSYKAAEDMESSTVRFQLARALVLLRREYIASSVQSPSELAGSLSAMIEMARSKTGETDGKTAKSLRKMITPMAFDQLRELLAQLDAEKSAAGKLVDRWLEASERTANRIALWLVGELATALEVIEAGSASEDRKQRAREDIIRVFCSPAMRKDMTVAKIQPVTRTPAEKGGEPPSAQGKSRSMRKHFRNVARNVTEELSLDSL